MRGRTISSGRGMSYTSDSISDQRRELLGSGGPNLVQLWGSRGLLVRRCHVRRSLPGRAVGLLTWRELADDEALLITRCKSVHTFAMSFSIDLVFVDPGLRIVDLKRQIAPWRSPRRVSAARHVIEVSAGSIDRWSLSKGDQLEVRGYSGE